MHHNSIRNVKQERQTTEQPQQATPTRHAATGTHSHAATGTAKRPRPAESAASRDPASQRYLPKQKHSPSGVLPC